MVLRSIPTERLARVTAASGRLPRNYLVLLAAAFRGQAQYRANVLLMTIGGVLYQCVGIAVIWVVVARFGHLGGWSLNQLVFLYGMRLTAHALWTIPFNQLNRLDEVVQQGELDRYLVRPCGVLTQLVTRRLDLQVLGDAAGGIALLAVAIVRVGGGLTPSDACYLVVAVVGGAMVELSLQLGSAALCFRFESSRALRITLDNVFTTFGGYPIKIFPATARFALTFVVPLAFVAYLPTSVLLGTANGIGVNPTLAVLSPLAGLGLFCCAYLFWRSQLRHYDSTGN